LRPTAALRHSVAQYQPPGTLTLNLIAPTPLVSPWPYVSVSTGWYKYLLYGLCVRASLALLAAPRTTHVPPAGAGTNANTIAREPLRASL
jgi:hypothetical protein